MSLTEEFVHFNCVYWWVYRMMFSEIFLYANYHLPRELHRGALLASQAGNYYRTFAVPTTLQQDTTGTDRQHSLLLLQFLPRLRIHITGQLPRE